MSLTEEDRERLADVVRLQPTKNADLCERWGLEDGSAVHGYLESTLADYYYRDDNSYIRATEEAADLVDAEPGVESGADGAPDLVRVPELEAQVVGVLASPDERSESVVSVLHALRDACDVGAEADDVREALQALRRKGVVEVEYRAVPTYRLAVERDALTVEVVE